jgi:hypothetical protein
MCAVEAQRCVCADSDDALDAAIAALTSRAAALSKTSTPMKHTCCNKRGVRGGSRRTMSEAERHLIRSRLTAGL